MPYPRQLSLKDVYNIREKYLKGENQLDLASEYNISQKTISKIINLKIYKNVAIPNNYSTRLKKRRFKTKRLKYFDFLKGI